MKLVNEVEYSRFTISELFKKLNGSQIYSVDSFPVELCQIQREKKSKLWRDVSLI